MRTIGIFMSGLALAIASQSGLSGPTLHGLSSGEHAETFGAGASVGNAVVRTSDGGFLAVGYTGAGEFGGEDVYVVRTDRAGRSRWARTIGGRGDDDGWAVARTGTDGFLVVGFTTSFGADGEDVLLLSLDEDGRTRWTKTIGGPGNQRAWAMSPAPGGGFYIAAQTDRGPGGGWDACVYNIDAAGAPRWSRAFGGPGADRLFGIVTAADGGPTVAGLSSTAPGAKSAAYIAHLGADGVVQWEQRKGGPADDLAHAIAATTDGGYLLTGYGQSQGAGANDVYLMKFDASGRWLWTRTAGGSGDDRGMMSLVLATGILTIGYTRLADHDWEIWIGEFDDSGHLRKQRVVGSDHDDRAVMIADAGGGEFVVTGQLGRDAGGSALLLLWIRWGM